MIHRRTWYVVLALTFVCALVGCSKKETTPNASSAGTDAHELADKLDGINLAALTGPNHQEARAWISDTTHKGIKVSHDATAALVEKIYSAGAPQVDATGIENDGTNDVSNALIVRLPKETGPREKVFAIEAAQRVEAGEQATPDQGQQTLRFKLD